MQATDNPWLIAICVSVAVTHSIELLTLRLPILLRYSMAMALGPLGVMQPRQRTGDTEAQSGQSGQSGQSHQALRALAQLRYALDQHAYVTITDRKGLITYANDKLCAFTQYSQAEILGRTPALFKSGEHPPEFFRDLWSTISSGNVWRGEICNLTKSGEPFWVEMTIVPHQDASGAGDGYIGIATELTQHKRLQQQLAEQIAELRATEDRLLEVSNNIPAMIAYWDKDGICRFTNRGHFAHLGSAPRRVVGMSYLDLFASESLAVRRIHTAEALKGKRQVFDQSTEEADGSVRHWHSEYLPKIKDGVPDGFYAVVVDVTQRKNDESRLAQQEARLAATSRMVEIGGWELVRDAKRLICSDMVYHIYELPVGEPPLLEETLNAFGADVRALVVKAIDAVFTDSSSFDLVAPLTTAKGNHRWVRIIGEPQLENGRCTRIVGALQDVTDARRAEETMRLAKEAAEAASRAKGDFLANMSHEIRTPLNGVIGMTGLLLDMELGTQQREYVEVVRSSGESLLGIINDILDFSKIEAGHIDLESIDIDLHVLLEDAIDVLALRAAEKGLELKLIIDPDVPRCCRGDPTRIRQILLNLVSNAIKFTGAGSVSLTVDAAPGTDGRRRFTFAVRDSGIGIPADRIETLFAPFIQADTSTTRRFGGTGLGLSISKRLAQIMGGTIDVVSEVGMGSTFTLCVELEPVDVVAGTESVSGHLAGLRILLAVHLETMRNTLERQLVPEGCELTFTQTAHAALAEYAAMLARDRPPAAIIVDSGLPDHSGAWLAANIRASAAPPASLILLTESSTKLSDAELSSIDRVISKPAKTSTLVGTLAELTRMGRATITLPGDTQVVLPFSGLRFLLAEDNPVNQKLAVRLLEKRGAHVQVAGTGLEALQALRDADFDAVLMDCQMPELDGYEATRRLRSGASGVRNPRIPVIALTAHALNTDRAKCLAAGMTDYLTKPINPNQLQQTLSRLLTQDAREGRLSNHPETISVTVEELSPSVVPQRRS